MKKYTAFTILFLTLLTCASSLTAGIVYKFKNIDYEDEGSNGLMTISVEGKYLKLEMTGKGAENGAMIFDGIQMIWIDHKRKTYTVIDEATIQKIAGQLNAAMAQYQQMLKQVPASQRPMMEKMWKEQMGGAMAPAEPKVPSELVKGKKSKTIAKYKTNHYLERKGNMLAREFWVTDWDNIEGGDASMVAFEGLAAFQEKLAKAFSGGGNNPFMGMANSFQDNMFKELKELGGFPVSVRNFKNGAPSDESILQFVGPQTFEKGFFNAPKNYKRQRMDGR